MTRRRGSSWLVVLAAGALGCHHRAPAAPARVPRFLDDDGTGVLATQAQQVYLAKPDKPDGDGDETPPAPAPEGRRRAPLDAGDPLGTARDRVDRTRPFASWQPPNLDTTAVRSARYKVSAALPGAIEGTVTWAGAVPGRLVTACGTIDNPSVQLGAERGVADVIVTIERVAVGRAPNLPGTSRPLPIGGEVHRRGCAWLPTAQVATPQPVQLALTVDLATRAVVTPPTGFAPTTLALEDGGGGHATLHAGINRVEAEDGGLVPAWILVVDTPYVARTDADGHFRLDDLAPGTYDLAFWHAPVVTMKAGRLESGAPLVVHATVTVGAGAPARPRVSIGAPGR